MVLLLNLTEIASRANNTNASQCFAGY